MSRILYVHARLNLNAQMTVYALYTFFPNTYVHSCITCKNVYFLTNNLASLFIGLFTELSLPQHNIKIFF